MVRMLSVMQFRLILTLKRVAACLLIGLCYPAFSQTFELRLDEGRTAARQAAMQGQFQLARDLALALIQADPNDRPALVVLAAVQPQLGDGAQDAAQVFARFDCPVLKVNPTQLARSGCAAPRSMRLMNGRNPDAQRFSWSPQSEPVVR